MYRRTIQISRKKPLVKILFRSRDIYGQSLFLDDPKLFDTIEDAEQECNNWNTGTVVEYVTSKDIRPMDESERNRARVRSIKNQSNLEFDKALKKLYEGDDWDNWCDGDAT